MVMKIESKFTGNNAFLICSIPKHVRGELHDPFTYPKFLLKYRIIWHTNKEDNTLENHSKNVDWIDMLML